MGVDNNSKAQTNSTAMSYFSVFALLLPSILSDKTRISLSLTSLANVVYIYEAILRSVSPQIVVDISLDSNTKLCVSLAHPVFPSL